MNFVFANGALLPLLALAGLPLLVHLVARTRPQPYPFSSLWFIRRVVRWTRRVKRPQDWILLVLRTLLVAALVLLFLRPVAFPEGAAAGGGGRRNVVVVVDASASMAYVDGGQSRFAAACAEASEVLGGLSAGDRANVVWMDAPARAVFPELSPNVAHLQQELRGARVGHRRARPESALGLAADLLAGAEGGREICVISDFQRTAWEGAVWPGTPGAEVLRVDVARGPADNTALTRLYAGIAQPLAGEPVQVFCEVAHFSGQARRARVFFAAGESRQEQDISLQPWSTQTLAFTVRGAAPGSLPCRVRLSEDDFSADNARQGVLEVRGQLNLTVQPATSPAADAWARAARALGWVKVAEGARTDAPRGVSDPGLEPGDPGGADVVFVDGSGAADGAAATVGSFLGAGLPVIWQPAGGAPLAQVAGAGTNPALAVQEEERGEPFSLEVTAPDDAVFEVFSGGDKGDPTRAVITRRLRFEPGTLGEGAEVLLAYRDGVPALARCGPGRRLTVWNLPLDRAHSDLAAQPEFLPLVAEVILAARPGAAPGQLAGPPGRVLTLPLARGQTVDGLSLDAPHGGAVPFQTTLTGDGLTLRSAPLEVPGLYTWRQSARALAHGAVNLEAAESDLRPLVADPAGRSSSIQGLALEGGHSLRQRHEGVPLWPALLALAAGLGLIEGAVALWGRGRGK